jgi:hypothetical protein
MRAIKQVKKLIKDNPSSEVGQTFSKLILSLESDIQFAVKDLYSLDTSNFELAMEVLKDWRIDRFYIGKAKVFDMATHAHTVALKK